MSLTDRIKEDLKTSLKSGDQFRVGVLRMLLAEIYNKEKDKQGKGEKPILEDGEVVSVLQKEFKKRKDAINLFKQGSRHDLAEKEEKETGIIKNYLPEQAGEEEVSAVVEKIISLGNKNFVLVMREAIKELKGKADGKLVGEIVKKKLS